MHMTCWHRWNPFRLFSYQRWVPSLPKRWQFDTDWRCPSRWIVSRILANFMRNNNCEWLSIFSMNRWSKNNSSDNSSWLYTVNPKWIWRLICKIPRCGQIYIYIYIFIYTHIKIHISKYIFMFIYHLYTQYIGSSSFGIPPNRTIFSVVHGNLKWK